MNTYSYLVIFAIAIAFLFVVTSASIATAPPDDCSFTLIPVNSDIVYKNIFGIIIDLPYNGKVSDGSVPNTTFTIFPSNNDDGSGSGITVETSPPNLITVGRYKYGYGNDDGDYGGLSLEWNTIVSSTATSGGVRIGIPPDQLNMVWVYNGHSAQIVDGFTNITTLGVMDDGSIIRASMTSLSDSTELRLYNNVKGQMYVETNIPVTYGSVNGGGQSWVETPSFNDIRLSDAGSELNIKGDIVGNIKGDAVGSNYCNNNGGRVRRAAQLTVTGTITGFISSQNNFIVNAPSCDNVSSTCNAGPQNVDFDVGNLSKNSQILFGTYICSSSSSLLFAQGSYCSIAFVMMAAVTSMLIS